MMRRRRKFNILLGVWIIILAILFIGNYKNFLTGKKDSSISFQSGKILRLDSLTQTTRSDVENIVQSVEKTDLFGTIPPADDFQSIYRQIEGFKDTEWMLSRMKFMERVWLNASRILPVKDHPRTKKKIHVHLGLLEWGLANYAGKGAPVGELLQWSDVIASIHVLGHEVSITRTSKQLIELLRPFNLSQINSTRLFPYDLLYIDIIGYNDVLRKPFPDEVIPENIRCKVRVIDTWGTEAAYNSPDYAKRKNIKLSFYGGLDLNLKQFNTLYPHSPDNTFIGFSVERPSAKSEATGGRYSSGREIALLYAKSEDLLDHQYRYIELLNNYFEVHSTIGGNFNKKKPSYVTNHGVLSQGEFGELLRRSKVFVGFGSPYEGPGALDAIQNGAIFLNRKISVNLGKSGKHPTDRVLTSQNPYTENFIGRPHVYTLDITNETEVKQVLNVVSNAPKPGEFLPFEYSAKGMLQRLSILIEKQKFCSENCQTFENNPSSCTDWPPIKALKRVVLSRTDESCNHACDKLHLRCEPVFFRFINSFDFFSNYSACDISSTSENGDLGYPALNSGLCVLQSNWKLFSCAGRNQTLERLCPCRSFSRRQVEICEDCYFDESSLQIPKRATFATGFGDRDIIHELPLLSAGHK